MKKQYIFLAIVILLVGAVATLSIYKYNNQPKELTVSQAVQQRDLANINLTIQKQLNVVDKQAVANLTADKEALAKQKIVLCAQIKAAKLVQPLCQ